jgi:NifB/MoaA-like Fe-S oxidoreductase
MECVKCQKVNYIDKKQRAHEEGIFPEECEHKVTRPFKIKGSDAYRYYCERCYEAVEVRTTEEKESAQEIGKSIEGSGKRERTIAEKIVTERFLSLEECKMLLLISMST